METKIDYYREHGFPKLWIADKGDGTYTNPVICTDYADPDVVRVGSNFYMVSSSFGFSPGIPLLHSKDLINWSIINYIVEELPFSNNKKVRNTGGLWAPSIRYHDSKFWVFFCVPDEGIYMSKTADPLSKWEARVKVIAAKGWIDPCPFWDEDGNAYLVNAFAKSRAGINSVINISRMSADGTKLLDEGIHVFDGRKNHPVIEGPKIYKRNGYYYIFCPAGGISEGWQTVLRSKSIYGPYEDKVVLHQGDTDINGPHQGGWVELENGESWFLHFQDAGNVGRIIHLQPVSWIDDWPLIGEDINKDGIGEPGIKYKKPDTGNISVIKVPDTSDDFEAQRLGLQWKWNDDIKEGWYSLNARKSHLRLYSINELLQSGLTLWDAPNLLHQKFPAHSFNVTVKVEFHPQLLNEKVGLAICGDQYAYISIINQEEGLRITYTESVEEGTDIIENKIDSHPVEFKTVYLRVGVIYDGQCSFSYSVDGVEFVSLGREFKAKAGKGGGSRIGVFCINPNKEKSSGYADFDWVVIEDK
jgi:beta-xylosidase